MLINVSTLLREPVGSAREYDVVDERVDVPGEDFHRLVTGHVHLLRTERGVLVRADFMTSDRLECDRCLTEFTQPVTIDFDEEFVDDVAVNGQPTDPDPEEFRIDQWKHLDLSEAVRQYGESALPLHPLCREDCAGLCPSCGQDLNAGRCSCAATSTDHRWAALESLSRRMHPEEIDGRPEA